MARTKGSRRQPVPHFLREWREERQLTQEQLAERIGTTHGTVSRIETGSVDLSARAMVRYAVVLGIHPCDLFRSPADEHGIWALAARIAAMPPHQIQTAWRLIEALQHANS